MKEINFFHRKTMKKFPVLHKQGAISTEGGECTPFLYKGRLLLLENYWSGCGELPGPCGVILDYTTREILGSMGGDGCRFYSAYCENDTVCVFAALENRIYRYTSVDLVHWEKSLAFAMPEMFEIFNTSVCKGDGVYMMAFECAWKNQSKGECTNAVGNPYIGQYYTEFFASSPDLADWTPLDFEKSYTTQRYCACPVLRFCEGYYYMICLEELPCTRYAPYMYRTKDFETWEIGLYNPIMIASEEDRHIKPGYNFPPEIVNAQATHVNINNSDVDMVEYEGRTILVYASGNQGTTGAFNGLTCEAVYDGPMDEYLKANFDE